MNAEVGIIFKPKYILNYCEQIKKFSSLLLSSVYIYIFYLQTKLAPPINPYIELLIVVPTRALRPATQWLATIG